MTFTAGDLIKTKHKLVGEVVSVLENDLEVYFLVPDLHKAKGKIWVYREDWDTIPKKSVETHIKIIDKTKYPEYYKQLGFKAFTENLFVQKHIDLEKDEDLKNYHFPTNCIESDDDDNDYDFTDGFVVKDTDGEAFSFASPDSTFVQETHKAVHEYNKWEPKNKKQLSIKNFIDEIELKYSTMDDDKHFKNGASVDYKQPPMAPRASKRHKSTKN